MTARQWTVALALAALVTALPATMGTGTAAGRSTPVRAVAIDTADCPTIETIPFGAAPDHVVADADCRTFVARQDQRISITSGWAGAAWGIAGGRVRAVRVHDQTGRVVCVSWDELDVWHEDLPRMICQLDAGPHVIRADRGSHARDVAFGVYDLDSDAGCQPLSGPFTTVNRTVEPGQLNCFLVRTVAGVPIGFARPGRGEQYHYGLADGSAPDDRCWFDNHTLLTCVPTRTGEFRLLGGEYWANTRLHETITMFDPASSWAGCQALTEGTTTVRLTDRVACVRVDDLRFTHDTVIRTPHEGGVVTATQLLPMASPSRCATKNGFHGHPDVKAARCRAPYDGLEPVPADERSQPLLITGDGRSATLEVTRQDVEVDLIRVTNIELPTVVTDDHARVPLEQVGVGDRVRVDRGSWRPSADAWQFQWLLDGRPLPATTVAFTVRPHHVGGRLSVRVAGTRHGEFYPGSATSAPVAVSGPPGRVTAPRVRTSGRGATIRWDAPAANFAPITDYVLRLDDRWIRVAGTRRAYTLTRLDAGRHVISVYAVNRHGPSPAAPRTWFRVR